VWSDRDVRFRRELARTPYSEQVSGLGRRDSEGRCKLTVGGWKWREGGGEGADLIVD
jgi:hypothetical protein